MRWIIRLVGLVGLAALVGIIGGRFSDGPIGPFPGGPLRNGDIVGDRHVDWSFAKDVNSLEMQLVDPPRSRTLWLLVNGQQLYVPCGIPNFTLWKQWPHEAMLDGNAIIRIDGKRYERRLERVTQLQMWQILAEQLDEKYGTGAELDENNLWFFRVAPRL